MNAPQIKRTPTQLSKPNSCNMIQSHHLPVAIFRFSIRRMCLGPARPPTAHADKGDGNAANLTTSCVKLHICSWHTAHKLRHWLRIRTSKTFCAHRTANERPPGPAHAISALHAGFEPRRCCAHSSCFCIAPCALSNTRRDTRPCVPLVGCNLRVAS